MSFRYSECHCIETFTMDGNGGYIYDQAGLSIQFSRKSLGDLPGSFYGPTAIFAILSLISFHIHPDKVSYLQFLWYNLKQVNA